MSEQSEALGELEAAGVLEGLRWAWGSARRQTLQSFDPATGHDQGWVGYNAYKVLGDRLDRVFSLRRFALAEGLDVSTGADVVAEGLTSAEFSRMPRLAGGLVVRDDVNASPGWRHGRWRLLLQSHGGQEIDRIPWAQKSQTKREVASPVPPDEQLLLLEDFFGLPADVESAVVTLVAAYAIDTATGTSGLHLGHPRLNHGGGRAWKWRVQIDENMDGEGARPSTVPAPGSPTPGSMPDAPVRLRPPAREDAVAEEGR